MTEIRLEIAEGRVHVDHLGVAERAVVDWLAELPDDRLRVVVDDRCLTCCPI
jgi:hypothetical protein